MRKVTYWVVLFVAVAGLAYGQSVEPVSASAFPSASDPQKPAVVWAVGDGGTNSPASAQVANLLSIQKAKRVIYLGDVYDTGTWAEFDGQFRTVFSQFLKQMLPTPGNHDWPNRQVGYKPFWQQVTGQKVPYWYTVRIGGWKLLSVNSEQPASSSRLAWLKTRLTNKGPSCKLVFMHRPRFNAGNHGDAADLDSLWRVMRGRARMVIAGHDHNMQQFKAVDRTSLLISGAGGRGLYPVKNDSRLIFKNDSSYGALKLELKAGQATASFVDVNGVVLRKATFNC